MDNDDEGYSGIDDSRWNIQKRGRNLYGSAPFCNLKNHVDVVLFQVVWEVWGQDAGESGRTRRPVRFGAVVSRSLAFLTRGEFAHLPAGRTPSPLEAAASKGLRPREMTSRTAGGRGPRAAGTVEVSVMHGVCPLIGRVHLSFVLFVKVPAGPSFVTGPQGTRDPSFT